MNKYQIDPVAKKILEFWFSEANKEKWWIKDEVFDQLIKQNFHTIYKQAAAGLLDNWIDLPEEALALIIVLDQFPRNMFRNSHLAYETDEEAVNITKHAIKYKYDYKLTNKEHRHFLYMPLMHSENLDDQNLAIEKFATISKEAMEFAKAHHEIIVKFNRFPHRNKVLNRDSTEKEIVYLSKNKLSFF